MNARRLAGKTVLMTRPEGRGGLARLLEKAGARVVSLPLIKIVPPRSHKRLDAAIRKLDEYDAVVFTSRSGVERFFRRTDKRPRRTYAIGKATADALKERGIRPAGVPEISRGEELARLIKGRRVLLPRAERAREILPQMLRRRGIAVEIVDAYRTVDDEKAKRRLRALAESDALHAITFTSASTVRSLLRQLGARRWNCLRQRVAAAAIGPVTSSVLRKAGARLVFEAARADEKSLAAAVARALS